MTNNNIYFCVVLDFYMLTHSYYLLDKECDIILIYILNDKF